MKNLIYILFVVFLAILSQYVWPSYPVAQAEIYFRDTVYLRDTVLRVDTVLRIDTIVKFEKPKAIAAEFKKKSLYKIVALHIKTHEGFRPDVYRCAADYKTIGWGHLWKEGEPRLMDKRAADILFQTDFQRKYDRLGSLLPGALRHEKLAFTMLGYQCSLKDFKTSNLYRAMQKHIKYGKVVDGVRHSAYESDVRKYWGRYIRYKKNGEWKTHPQFRVRRAFEVNLFLKGESWAFAQEEEVIRLYKRKEARYKEDYKTYFK